MKNMTCREIMRPAWADMGMQAPLLCFYIARKKFSYR